jgi:NAD-dependent SIR2 family protein deacetylase
LALYRATVPHAGFSVLRRWAEARPARVFTSNVDGQFQRAGFDEHSILECHGSIHHLQCLRGCTDEIWPADGIDVEVDEVTMRAVPPLPSCPRCGGLARPNILMFGDFGWVPARTEAQAREHADWLRSPRDSGRGRLVVVELGAGTAVPTVRRHAELNAAATGALIRINTREPAVRHGHGVPIPLPAAEALRRIDTLVDTPLS